MASRESPYNVCQHVGSAIKAAIHRTDAQIKDAINERASSTTSTCAYLTACVQDIAEVQQQLTKIGLEFGLKVDLAVTIDCLAEFRFESFPESLVLLELNVKISWVSAVHVNKWFEDRKKPRNVSISNLEVAM